MRPVRARQRALPAQVTIAVAEIGRVDRAHLDLQVALRRTCAPGQPHAHVVQCRDRRRELRDAHLRDARRLGGTCAGSHRPRQCKQQD
jgi:hypothetical protein